MTTPKDIAELQALQDRHDRDCHLDIAHAVALHRLKHLAIHFGKYLARLVVECGNGTGLHAPTIRKTMADAALIALSMANVTKRDLRDCQPHPNPIKKLIDLCYSMATPAQLATSAADKGDHMEPGFSPDQFSQAAEQMFAICMTYFGQDIYNTLAAHQAHIRTKGVQ